MYKMLNGTCWTLFPFVGVLTFVAVLKTYFITAQELHDLEHWVPGFHVIAVFRCVENCNDRCDCYTELLNTYSTSNDAPYKEAACGKFN